MSKLTLTGFAAQSASKLAARKKRDKTKRESTN